MRRRLRAAISAPTVALSDKVRRWRPPAPSDFHYEGEVDRQARSFLSSLDVPVPKLHLFRQGCS